MKAILEKIKAYPLAVVVAVLSLALLGVYFLRVNVVPELEIIEEDLVGEVSLIQKNAQHANGLEQHLETLEATVSTIDERLFERDEVAINANFFYKLQREDGARIIEVNQLAPPGGKDTIRNKGLKQFEVIDYSVDIVGTFPQIVAFFQEINRVEPFVRVAGFNLEKSAGKNSVDPVLNAKLRIEVLGRIDT